MRARRSSRLNSDAYRAVNVMFDNFEGWFYQTTGLRPFPYQVRAATGSTLPALVRIPTGCGKTEAVVCAWMWRRKVDPRNTPRRLVYCLPLRALVHQTAERARRLVAASGSDIPVRILMGGAADDEWAMAPEKEAIIVGTMDMLLSRALARGYGLSRFRYPVDFGLLTNDCLWAFDEVQLMGNGLTTSCQLAGLINRPGHFGPSHFLWLSATVEPSWLGSPDFTAPRREEILELGGDDLAAPALSTRVQAQKEVRRLDGGYGLVAARLRDLAREAGRRRGPVLVVVNTVERAVEVWKHLSRGGLEPMLVHGRFRPIERRRLEQQLAEAQSLSGRVIVSTQVVEAGLDLSAWALVTEQAPPASLVQRLGRCNRFGEWDDAQVWWVPVSGDHQAPYSSRELEEGRELLEELEGKSASPGALYQRRFRSPEPPLYTLRRRDMESLFDTTPDLCGNEADASRFIRDDRELDLYLFWREVGDSGPPPDAPRPTRDELCPVPLSEAREFLFSKEARGRRAWTFDYLEGSWVPLRRKEDVRPGMRVMLDAALGGYDPEVGFRPDHRRPVPTVSVAESRPEEGIGGDELSMGLAWKDLDTHGRETGHEMKRMIDALGQVVPKALHRALMISAEWHDIGKAHPVFQRTMQSLGPPSQGVWARSSRRGKHDRACFRHELAGALALLRWSQDGEGPLKEMGQEERELCLYLVAAHHGRVRLAIRSVPGEEREAPAGCRYALGVREGDSMGPLEVFGHSLPPATLGLDAMELGAEFSWSRMASNLLRRCGPFRLAFLEALLRVADWRASGMAPL